MARKKVIKKRKVVRRKKVVKPGRKPGKKTNKQIANDQIDEATEGMRDMGDLPQTEAEAKAYDEAKVVKPAAKAPEIKKGWSVSEAGILLRDGELVKCPFDGFKHCNNKCPHYEHIKLSPPKTRIVGAMLTCGTSKRISFDS